MFKPKHTVPAFFVHTLWPLTKRVFVVSVLSLLLLPLFFLTRGGTGVPHAYAATSDNLNFQARLETAAGAIAPDGYYNVQFKLYDASTSGTLLWTETYYDSNGGTAGNDNRVRVANGYVTVNLGSQTTFPSNMPWDQQLYLTMNVGGTTQTATPTWDGEMSPRLKLTAVPYAFNAKTASQIVSSSGANLATLSIAAPTSGNQTFTIQDQGAAGSYNILTQNQIQAGFIQNQNAAAQTTANFWISGNGRSDTAFQAPLFDTATAAALGIGTTNASSITIGATTVTTTVQGPFVANGSQFTNNGSTLLTGNTLSDFAASGAVGTAAATVDIYTTFVIPQTTAGRTLSLPAPTTGTAGRLAYVLNTGSSAFTMHGVSIQSGKAQTYIYDGSAWTATNIDGAGSGATFVGTIDSQTKSGDGAVLSGNGIYLQTADGSNPGLVSTGIQTFAGDKTFSGNVTINTGLTVSGANIDLNASSNFNTNINTGTSTGAVNIGNGAAGNISIQSGGTIGLTGTTTVLGTTTINGSGSAATTISTGTGNTTIGNTTGTTSITGSTNTVVGTTNINTTGTSTTTIGSATAGAVSITSNAASSFTTNTGALTLTSAAAATWGTNAGALTLQGAGGTTVTSTAGATSGDTTISTGNASAGASGNIAIDTGTATTTAGTVSIGTTNASGVTIGRAATTTTIQGTLSITPQASSSTTLLCTNGGVLSTCDASVIAPTATNFIQNQNAIQQTTANFWISGTGRADTSILTPTLDTATATTLNIGTTNATSVNINQNTVLASGKTITITGDTRANIDLIGTPTEGMTTYDTTNKQLLTYSNGKWQADRHEAILVAANNSTQAEKDAADYVATGTGDESTINTALTAADPAGSGRKTGKVYLFAGTYNLTAAISVPNNTTLAGSGNATVITVPSSQNGSYNMISAASTTVIRDLKVDGNKAGQTSGTMQGVYLASNSTVSGVTITNIYGATGSGIKISGKNNTVSGNTLTNNSYAGVYDFGGSTNGLNIITDNTVTGNAYGISVIAPSDIISNNVVSGGTAGILISTYSKNIVTNNTVESNTYGVYLISGASNNIVKLNSINNNGDGTSTNNGIYLSAADSNTITDNNITDTSCTASCYAINISNAGSDTNYLGGNTFTGDGTYTATINDAGTGTIYAGQSMTQGGLDIRFRQANSTTAFNIQNANGISVLNIDTTNGELEVGNYNGGTNPVAGKIVLATTANANTVTLSSATQTTGSFTLSIPDLTANADVCTSLNNCGSLTSTSGIQNQNASAQTANFWISGTGRADTSILTPTLDTATAVALNIGTTNATSINLNQDTVLASGQSITITGGNTASRPASPTEGMVYYDTTTKQLLTYANGKWQADRSEAVLVAASNSSDADKAAADYVGDGNTGAANDGDQVQINQALTAGAGKKVVLLAGTYTIDASISIPNNTTLSGIGQGTLITIPNALNTNFSAIVNTDTTTGTNVTLRDLKLDGNNANQSMGVGTGMAGVDFNNMGGGTGSSARQGARISGVQANNWDGLAGSNCQVGVGICLRSSSNNVLAGNTAQANAYYSFALISSSSNNTLTSNTAQGSLTDGFFVSSSNNNTLTGNTAQGNNGIGINISSSNNNTLTGNTAQGNTSYGILATSSSNNTISGNTSQGNTSYGIYITTSSSSNTVSSNTIQGNTSYGIYVSSSSTNNTLTGNSVKGNSAGIVIVSNANTVSGNTLADNGGSTANNGIYIGTSANNTIIGNTITDTSCTTTCYAINLLFAGATSNYLSGNTFTGDGTYAATINDAGTNTIYAGQSMTQGGLDIRFKQANSSTAFNIQNANGVSVMNVDTTNGELELGNYNGGTNPVAGKIVLATTANANTVTLSSATQTTGSFTLSIPDLTANADVCTSLNNCGSLTSTSGIQNQNASAQTANFWISGTGRADTSILTPTLDTATAVALNIGTTNATSINLNQDTVLASGQSITITGGNTASRPASPTEGMVYYDTTTKQLLTYANGKWQADRSEAVLVAASNSSDADKAAADYVADGDTVAAGDGDQVEINNALSRADPASAISGARKSGKVYLFAGTYTIDASVSMPNNTTLVGAGRGTVITLPNSFNASINAVTNTTTGGNGTGVVVQNLRLDGNKANQTSGATNGIYFNGVGSGTGSSAVQGGKIVGVWSNGWYGGHGINLSSSSNNTVTGNTDNQLPRGQHLHRRRHLRCHHQRRRHRHHLRWSVYDPGWPRHSLQAS
jgi:parallel beta-helix repeat protein